MPEEAKAVSSDLSRLPLVGVLASSDWLVFLSVNFLPFDRSLLDWELLSFGLLLVDSVVDGLACLICLLDTGDVSPRSLAATSSSPIDMWRRLSDDGDCSGLADDLLTDGLSVIFRFAVGLVAVDSLLLLLLLLLLVLLDEDEDDEDELEDDDTADELDEVDDDDALRFLLLVATPCEWLPGCGVVVLHVVLGGLLMADFLPRSDAAVAGCS
jgi:hypothetical protein